jgi:archaemetzincin
MAGAGIGLARLRQEFYGLKSDNSLFLERVVKEATHELGHAFGLRHCPRQKCVMFFSNSLADTDRKCRRFCNERTALLYKR